ncbi:MAG: Jag N-terminal domain-containing protein [Synergistaceae bacterium]|jgi:spoIIIJ-associated protein|nr:Jag N-terminal domain-containing protein [Synergistaceae bacterium]
MTNVENTERPAAAVDNESMILEAKSLESAIDTACKLWKVKKDDLETVVLDDGKRLFGLLGRKMKIKVTTLFPLMYLQARDFANSVLSQSELDLEARVENNRTISLEGNDSAIVIGRHGETLKAFEFLTNLIYRTDQSFPKIRFDCAGYRARREESLIHLAESVAREVIHKRVPVSLEPMSSWERRVIHLALQDNREISTSSEGEEPMRKIVVYPSGHSEHRRNFRRRRPRAF